MKPVDTLRALLKAPAQFEVEAAHHKRIESEHQALNDATTQAQLILSASDEENTSHSNLPDRLSLSREIDTKLTGSSWRKNQDSEAPARKAKK